MHACLHVPVRSGVGCPQESLSFLRAVSCCFPNTSGSGSLSISLRIWDRSLSIVGNLSRGSPFWEVISVDPGGHTAQHLFMFLFECQDACSVSPPSVGGSGSSITDTKDQFQDFLAEKQPLIFVLNCKNQNKNCSVTV